MCVTSGAKAVGKGILGEDETATQSESLAHLLCVNCCTNQFNWTRLISARLVCFVQFAHSPIQIKQVQLQPTVIRSPWVGSRLFSIRVDYDATHGGWTIMQLSWAAKKRSAAPLSILNIGAVQILRNAPGGGGGRPGVTVCDGGGGGSGRALRNARFFIL